MRYKIEIEGFEGQNIEIETAGFFSGFKIFVNGVLAPKGNKRGEVILRKNDGSISIATWKQQMLGLDFPQLAVDGKIIKIVEPLKWYEYIWNGLPILLIFTGGFIGAFFGVIGFSSNIKIFRSTISTPFKFISTALVSGLTVVIYLITVALFMMLVE